MTDMRLIDELRKYAAAYQNPNRATGREIDGTVELLIAAADALEEAQPQWIPFEWRKPAEEEDGSDALRYSMIACGELPENEQEILVTNGEDVWSDIFFDDDGLEPESGTDLLTNDLTANVIAWMPMPEPYEPEEEDK